jgi:dTDP-glucose 4,6-dehydratase
LEDFGVIDSNARFLYFSTDEVYGPAPETSIQDDGDGGLDELPFKGFKEWDRLNPNNPYAAAKAAAEMAVISFANTYRIPTLITNTMNIFGERQNPEKFIPLIINKVLSGKKLLIHSNKDKTQAGKRHYLCRDSLGGTERAYARWLGAGRAIQRGWRSRIGQRADGESCHGVHQ